MSQELKDQIREELEAAAVTMVYKAARKAAEVLHWDDQDRVDVRGILTCKERTSRDALGFFSEKIETGEKEGVCYELICGIKGIIIEIEAMMKWLDDQTDFDLCRKRDLFLVIQMLPTPVQCCDRLVLLLLLKCEVKRLRRGVMVLTKRLGIKW